MVKYSVIIPTYNRPTYLSQLLNDLLIQEYPTSKFEVIVYNDGGNKEVVKIVKKFSGSMNIKLLGSRTRVGSTVSRNECINASSGKYAIFLDDDIRLPKDFLKNVDMYTSDNVVFFSVRIENIKQIEDKRPMVIKLLERAFLGKIFLPFGMIVGGFSETLPCKKSKLMPVDHLPGCFVADLEVIRHSGLEFDRYLGRGNGYLDDCDFSYSARRLGENLYYIPSYHIVHLQAPSGGNREQNYGKWLYYYWNHKAYFIKKHGRSWYIYTAFVFALLECILICLFKRSNYLTSFLKGWEDGLRRIHRY